MRAETDLLRHSLLLRDLRQQEFFPALGAVHAARPALRGTIGREVEGPVLCLTHSA